MNRLLRNALVASILALHAAAAAENASEGPLSGGNVEMDLRYRLEWVDEAGFADDAEASTLRTRLRFRSDEWKGFSFLVEFADVRAIGLDDYNAGAGATPGRTRFPVVADAEDTRVNQAWAGIRPMEGLQIRAGRQRIKLDNDRFVGNVGWRQNEQTYDGASAEWRRGPVRAFYGYVGHVNRIFDSDVPAGDHGHDTHLLNLSLDAAEHHRLTAYLYDIDDEDADAFSSRTMGIRYAGHVKRPGADRGLDLLAEYARQRDAADNPVDYTADYLHLRARLDLAERFRPLAGFERLGGSRRPGAAFRTPLATLHAFNGWADRFLATPDRGLDDFYAGFSGAASGVGYKLVWHRFEAETGDVTYGNELDASVSFDLPGALSLLIKAARFEDDDPGIRSVTKFWTMLSFDL